MDFREFKGTVANGLCATTSVKLENEKKNEVKKKKCAITDAGRLENLKNFHKTSQNQDRLVSVALKNGGGQNKKIKFEYSDEEETLPKANDLDGVKKGVQLFDDEDFDEKVEEFSIPPQYEGKAGQRLMTFQTKFNGDARFKMNKEFLDDFKAEGDAEVVIPEVSDTQVEQKHQIDILTKILGKQIKTKTIQMDPVDDETVHNKFKSNSLIIRYDPDNPEHSRYRKHAPDAQEEVELEKTPSKTVRVKKRTENGLPEQEIKISTKSEYKMDRNFAERLKETANFGQQSSSFSILENLGRKNVEIDKEIVSSSDAQETKPMSKWQLNLLNENRSRNDEDFLESKNVTKMIKKEQKIAQNLFFFYPDDPRLKVADKFCRNLSQENVRKIWEKRRLFLIKFYKKRRKDAVRIMKKRQNPSYKRESKTKKKILKEKAETKK